MMVEIMMVMVMVMVMVMMTMMIRVKAGGGRIVELDCEGGDFDWLVGWLMREEDGICLFGVSCTTGRTDGREDGMGYGIPSTSVVTSIIDLEGMIDALGTQ